jgi:hypothetical protein
MSQYLCAKTYKVRPVTLRLSLLGSLVLSAAALFANTGCEDKAIGRPCDVLTDAGASQAVFNAEALECPSRICLKPVVDPTGQKMPSPTTTAYCSASCSQDSDCSGAQSRTKDPNNTLDRRCNSGFVCGIAFVKGKICCQKLCLCNDFLPPGGAQTPIACTGAAASTCNDPSQ